MMDLIVNPSATAPPGAPAARPGRTRGGPAQEASFEKTFQAAERSDVPERSAELAAASQAGAQAQMTQVHETPPEIETPAEDQPLTGDIGPAAQNPALFQAAAMLTGQPANTPETPSVDVTGAPIKQVMPSEPQPIAPASEQVQSGAQVALTQTNLNELDGVPSSGADGADPQADPQNGAAAFQVKPVPQPVPAETAQHSIPVVKAAAGTDGSVEVQVEREEHPVNAGKTENRPAQPANSPFPTELAGAKITATGVMMSEPARLSEARSGETLRQISSAIDSLTRAGQGSLRLQLNPQELGRIDLRLSNSPEGLRVWIQADQPATSRMLEASLKDLRQTLSDAGVQLSHLSVGQHGAQGGGSGHGSEQQPGRPKPYSLHGEVVEAQAREVPVKRVGQSVVDCQA